jgi:hypothetical protein
MCTDRNIWNFHPLTHLLEKEEGEEDEEEEEEKQESVK